MNRFPSFLLPLRALAVLSATLTAAPPPLLADPAEDLLAEIEEIQKESGTRTASIGFCLIPLETAPDKLEETTLGHRPDTGLIPASTLKAVSTATALEILGGDFAFTTELQLAGILSEDGVLDGDVVVRGGGDPTLGDSGITEAFAKWKIALDEAGVKKIGGSVVGDASVFGTTRRLADSWQWNDFGNYYGAGASGLTFHQNQFFCTFRTSKAGAKADLIGTDPKLPEIEFVNEMRVGAAGSGDQGYIYGVPYGKVFHLRGTVPAGSAAFTIKGALPDPAFFCARAFTKYLDERDLPVEGEPTTHRRMAIAGESLAARETIHTLESAPLSELVVRTNRDSVNLRAECFHRMVGLEAKGKGGFDEAAAATEEHWEEKGVDMTGFHMADGSGLSRANTVTARQMAGILYHMSQSEEFEAFRDSLPVAGRSGTLRGIGRGSAAEGRIQAKSGTISRVKCYAGYATARSGKRYAFALFFNNFSGSSSDVKAKIVRVWNRMVDL